MADKIETIRVLDDNGQRAHVVKITSQIRIDSFSGSPEFLDGDVRYELPDGTKLNRVEGGFVIPGRPDRFTLA